MATNISTDNDSEKKKKKRSKNKDDSVTVKDLKGDVIADLKRQIEEAKINKDFKKAQKLREQLWTIQDTGVVDSIPESLLPSSSSDPSPPPPSGSVTTAENPNEKTLRKLEKKLKSIEELKTKRDKGVKLEKTQLAKIATENEVREEIKTLKEILETIS